MLLVKYILPMPPVGSLSTGCRDLRKATIWSSHGARSFSYAKEGAVETNHIMQALISMVMEHSKNSTNISICTALRVVQLIFTITHLSVHASN